MYNNRVMEVALLQAETYQGNMYRVAMGGYEMDINGSCFFSGRHATKTNTTLKTCSPPLASSTKCRKNVHFARITMIQSPANKQKICRVYGHWRVYWYMIWSGSGSPKSSSAGCIGWFERDCWKTTSHSCMRCMGYQTKEWNTTKQNAKRMLPLSYLLNQAFPGNRGQLYNFEKFVLEITTW